MCRVWGVHGPMSPKILTLSADPFRGHQACELFVSSSPSCSPPPMGGGGAPPREPPGTPGNPREPREPRESRRHPRKNLKIHCKYVYLTHMGLPGTPKGIPGLQGNLCGPPGEIVFALATCQQDPPIT